MDVNIRTVGKRNLEVEFDHIRKAVFDFPFVAIDTEFPGILWKSPDQKVSYEYVKKNVNELKIIQIGMTLSNKEGKLPIIADMSSVWQFSFDFDPEKDRNNPVSIDFLRRGGFDFSQNMRDGIEPSRFAKLLKESGLMGSRRITWIVFQGAIDFGFLIRNLTNAPLPENEVDFFKKFSELFCVVYDLKKMMLGHELYGSLDKLAESLGVVRKGNAHEAGSDSLLTMEVYFSFRDKYFPDGGIDKYVNEVLGLGNIAKVLADLYRAKLELGSSSGS